MFTIKPTREHFEIYLDGEFYCSADTESEAEREIKEHESEAKANATLCYNQRKSNVCYK